MKDIVNHYRTLVAEALDAIYYDERLEDLGRALDYRAGRLAAKIRPLRPSAPAPALEGWEPLGWTTDAPSFAKFADDIYGSHFAELNLHIARMLEVNSAPAPEWASIPKADVEAMATIKADRPYDGPGIGAFFGMPLHLDPENEDMLRINLAELNARPDAVAVKQAVANFEAAMQGAWPLRFMAGVDPDTDMVKEFFDAYEGPMQRRAASLHKQYEAPFLQAIEAATNMSLVEWREATPRSLEAAAETLSDLTSTFVTDASPDRAKDTPPHD